MRDASTREKMCADMWDCLLALCFKSLRKASIDVVTIYSLSPSRTFWSPLHLPCESRPLPLLLPGCGEACSPSVPYSPSATSPLLQWRQREHPPDSSRSRRSLICFCFIPAMSSRRCSATALDSNPSASSSSA
jgi:hypothetical protein